jgi:hypothetical protein
VIWCACVNIFIYSSCLCEQESVRELLCLDIKMRAALEAVSTVRSARACVECIHKLLRASRNEGKIAEYIYLTETQVSGRVAVRKK